MEATTNAQVVDAYVSLSEMFGYATALRSKTQGRGVFTMQISHFEQVPESVRASIASHH
jgi:elongation factor G